MRQLDDQLYFYALRDVLSLRKEDENDVMAKPIIDFLRERQHVRSFQQLLVMFYKGEKYEFLGYLKSVIHFAAITEKDPELKERLMEMMQAYTMVLDNIDGMPCVKNVTELTWYDSSDFTEDFFQIQVEFEGTDGHIYDLIIHQNIDLDWSGEKILSDLNVRSEEYDEDDQYAINDLLTEAIHGGDQDTELMIKIFCELTQFDEFVEFTQKLEFDPELAKTIKNKRLHLAWENGDRYISDIEFVKWFNETDSGLVEGYFKIEVGFIGNDGYNYVLTFNTHMDFDSWYYHDQITEICVTGVTESEDNESNALYEAVKLEGSKAEIVNYILREIKEFSDYEDFIRDLKNNETFQEMVRTKSMLIAERE